MHKYQHAMVIGGTGMLQSASVAIAETSRQMTSVARTEASLRELDKILPDDGGIHHQLQLDWTMPQAFMGRILEHLSNTGASDLVVAWLHNNDLAIQLAEGLPRCGSHIEFFHVIGSASNNPIHIADTLKSEFTAPIHLQYHQVILGAQDSGIRSRWLTHHEISTGVSKAITLKQSQYIIGTKAASQSDELALK